MSSIKAVWHLVDRIGWVIAIALVLVAFALAYGKSSEVHSTQETHAGRAVTERQEIKRLDRESIALERQILATGH